MAARRSRIIGLAPLHLEQERPIPVEERTTSTENLNRNQRGRTGVSRKLRPSVELVGNEDRQNENERLEPSL